MQTIEKCLVVVDFKLQTYKICVLHHIHVLQVFFCGHCFFPVINQGHIFKVIG